VQQTAKKRVQQINQVRSKARSTLTKVKHLRRLEPQQPPADAHAAAADVSDRDTTYVAKNNKNTKPSLEDFTQALSSESPFFVVPR